ncbi:dioxygenase subfamily protein [Cryptococcus neoformans Bt120]|nr:dioxygenase subfamily protein [Cryptococcus neoformans var. grubii Bt15]OXG39287.1 dioxygenase subfamily protein [Cryptococcus neoformans var. grubii Bt120]
MRSLAILPLVTAAAIADRLIHPAPQVFFPDPDDVLHPDWPHRQSALGWDTVDRMGGDVAIGGGVGSCGGVCVLTPEVMEGPFYLDYHIERSNITEGLPGIPLTLVFHVFAVSSHLSDPTLAHSTCEPLPNAWIDIWSCDAVDGVYSGYGKAAEGPGPGRPPGGPPGGPGGPGGPHKGPHGPGGPGEDRPPMHQEPINNSTFLRGFQQTDENGIATFHTIYPGWYPGRTVHLHLKTHPPPWGHHPDLANATHTHTTQIFFPQELNDRVAEHPVYARNGARRVPNDKDGLFNEMKGASMARIEFAGDDLDEGIIAHMGLGIDKWW